MIQTRTHLITIIKIFNNLSQHSDILLYNTKNDFKIVAQI